MATDQLSLYNDALLLLGQRQLASLTEDREPRHRLDTVWALDAIRYCLELVKPNFATDTTTLSSPAAGTTFDYVHTLPAGHVAVVGVWQDAKLDNEVSRYIIEGNELLCDYSTVYLRHVVDTYSLDEWEPSFIRVVSAYLAREVSVRLSPDEYERIDKLFNSRVAEAGQLEAAKVPLQRPKSSSTTLTDPWRAIYNDALLIMGLDEITSNSDDSDRKVKLDRARDADLVSALLEDIGWQFGFETVKIFANPSVEPAFGYRYAFDKPADLHRIDGLYRDEYTRTPLDYYRDEGSYWFCDLTEIYLTYVSKDFLVNPSNWPSYFKRLVGACMAREAGPSLEADMEWVASVYEERERTATSNDAQASPPHKLANGSWVRGRMQGRSDFRNRP